MLTIDLDAIVANWRLLAAKHRHGQTAAVVKADAYGLGADKVAPALRAAGCRRFVVATPEEGLALRPLLGEAEIMVLSGPFPGSESLFVEHDLIPVLNSMEQVAAWHTECLVRSRRLPAILHVDTGMSRLGLSLAEAESLRGQTSFALTLVMSHLACSDEPDHEMNALQAERFARIRALFPGVEGSLAASSGIFLGEDYRHDWTRPGLALYGGNPVPHKPNPMQPVVTLQGRIVQTRRVDAGDTVGYGASYRCSGEERLAVVSVGYADGLFRSLFTRGCGHFEGVSVPLVGRVSMDLMIFDCAKAPAAKPGGLLQLIGPGNDLDAVAQAAGTIPYEILTALGRRYHRTYIGGAAQ